MSTEREEIRWKFQVILENLGMVKESFENQRKLIDERHVRAIQGIEKMRNLYFAFIGFFVTISISIIIARGFDDIYYLYPIIAGIIGFLIFFFTNINIAKAHDLFKEIDDTYFTLSNGLIVPLKGMISTYAFIEEFSHEDTINLVSYVNVIGQAVSYSFVQYLDEKLKWKQFKHENYRKYYDLAKSSLASYKEKNYSLGTEGIEQFIEEFEKNDKNKIKNKKPKN